MINFILYNLMKNFFNYIYSTKDQQPTQQQTPQQAPPPILIDYEQLKEFEEKIRKLDEENIKSFITKDSNTISIFEDLMGTLHGLINVISVIKGEIEQNYQKINEYDHLKKMLSAHNSMIKNLQQEESQKLNQLYEQNKKVKTHLEQQIQKLKGQNENLSEKIDNLEKQNNELKENNEVFSEKLKNLTEKLSQIQAQKEQQVQQMKHLIAVKHESIQIPKSHDLSKVTLEKLFVYSKIRKYIYPYLSLHDILLLSQTSKRFHYIIGHSFRRQVVPCLLNAQKKTNQKVFQQIKQYEKIYDRFPTLNIKTNALKYLYFKIKPGTYMLPFLQEELEQKLQEKKGGWKSFFTKKQNKQPKAFTISVLKNEEQFRQIQEKVKEFFDSLFGMTMPSDLQNFQTIMEKQLQQLKEELKGNEKSYQLLCMSKFLFVEVGELNNLLQVCFGELINEHHELQRISEQNRDLKTNDQTLRNLIENLANDRRQIEKRQWFLENETIKLKRQNEKMLQLTNQTGSKKEEMQRKINELNSELQKAKHEYHKEKKYRERFQTQFQEIVSILREEKKEVYDEKTYD